MNEIYTESSSGQINEWYESMDPVLTNYTAALNIYKYNFKTNYDHSRVPFGIYIHFHWFFKDNKNTDNY